MKNCNVKLFNNQESTMLHSVFKITCKLTLRTLRPMEILEADSQGKEWALDNFCLFLCIFQNCLDLQTNEQYPHICYLADSGPVLEVFIQPLELWREQYQGSADNEDKLQTTSSWFLKYRVSEALFSVSYSYIHTSNMHFTTAVQMCPVTTQLLNQSWHPVPNRSECGLHFLADHHSPRMTSWVLYLNVPLIISICQLHTQRPQLIGQRNSAFLEGWVSLKVDGLY